MMESIGKRVSRKQRLQTNPSKLEKVQYGIGEYCCCSRVVNESVMFDANQGACKRQSCITVTVNLTFEHPLSPMNKTIHTLLQPVCMQHQYTLVIRESKSLVPTHETTLAFA